MRNTHFGMSLEKGRKCPPKIKFTLLWGTITLCFNWSLHCDVSSCNIIIIKEFKCHYPTEINVIQSTASKNTYGADMLLYKSFSLPFAVIALDCTWNNRRPREIACYSGIGQSRGGNERVLRPECKPGNMCFIINIMLTFLPHDHGNFSSAYLDKTIHIWGPWNLFRRQNEILSCCGHDYRGKSLCQ